MLNSAWSFSGLAYSMQKFRLLGNRHFSFTCALLCSTLTEQATRIHIWSHVLYYRSVAALYIIVYLSVRYWSSDHIAPLHQKVDYSPDSVYTSPKQPPLCTFSLWNITSPRLRWQGGVVTHNSTSFRRLTLCVRLEEWKSWYKTLVLQFYGRDKSCCTAYVACAFTGKLL